MVGKRILTDNCAIHLLCLDRGSGYIAAIFPVDPSPSSLSLRSEDDMILLRLIYPWNKEHKSPEQDKITKFCYNAKSESNDLKCRNWRKNIEYYPLKIYEPQAHPDLNFLFWRACIIMLSVRILHQSCLRFDGLHLSAFKYNL